MQEVSKVIDEPYDPRIRSIYDPTRSYTLTYFGGRDRPDGPGHGLSCTDEANQEVYGYQPYMPPTLNAEELGLPQDFLDIVVTYVDSARSDYSAASLVFLWQKALQFARSHPELQTSIAEWTISAASRFPAIDDGNLFEAVHAAFAFWEVLGNNEGAWDELVQLVGEAARSK